MSNEKKSSFFFIFVQALIAIIYIAMVVHMSVLLFHGKGTGIDTILAFLRTSR